MSFLAFKHHSGAEMDGRLKRSLNFSIYDGIFYSLMVGLGEATFITYATHLHFSSAQIALLTALPLLLGSLMQLSTRTLAGALRSRKKLVCLGALFQAMLLPTLPFIAGLGDLQFPVFISISCLYYMSGMIIVPAWSGWMGDLVAENVRGRFFGHRSRYSGLATMLSMAMAGYILNALSGDGISVAGFAVLFMLAFACRLGSVLCLSKQWEPAGNEAAPVSVPLRSMMLGPEFKHFRALILFWSLMNFFVFVSAPFFTPYMLNVVGMDKLTLNLSQATIILGKFLSMPAWGRFADRHGNRKILYIVAVAMPVIPLCWLVSDNIAYIFILQFYSGLIWAGFDVASFNLVLDNTPTEARVAGVSVLNVCNGLATFLGAMTGILIISLASHLAVPAFATFLCSGIGRYAVGLFFFRHIREFREVEPVSTRTLLFRPFASLQLRSMIYVFSPGRRLKK